jgi:cytochrome c
MEFLDKLVLPHSGTNLEVLKYLLILAQLIFLIFSGALLGSTIISFISGLKANKNKCFDYARLAVDNIDLILSSKMMGVGLGIIPLFSILMIYLQLFHESGTEFFIYLILASALYLAGYIFLLIYRATLHSKNITAYLKKSNEVSGSFPHFNAILSLPGLLLIFLSSWILISTISLTQDSVRWVGEKGLLDIIFSASGLFEFVSFLLVSMSISSTAFLVKTFYWDKPENLGDSYAGLASKLNLTIALVFSLFQPILFILNAFLTPDESVSSLPYGLILLGLILTFVLVHFLYSNLKTKETNYSTISFYLVLTIFAIFVIKGQLSFGVASREQILKLSDAFDKHEAALMEKLGKSVNNINGEEIYKAKCTACHKFDEKAVGPPHKLVMAKYEGKQEEMVKFILNPVKIDPAYPLMPSQGLTPKEAKAIVEYMYKHYGEKIK